MNSTPANVNPVTPAPLLTEDYVPPSHGHSVLQALAAATVLPRIRLPALDADGHGSVDDKPVYMSQPVSAHRYSFTEEIARGGMGVVLRGRDEDLGREIAIKVMLERYRGQNEYLQRFIEEVQITAQLQHPGIPPVYELGLFTDGRPYFSMKLVRGVTMAQLMVRTNPTQLQSRLLKIFEQICQTMAYAHARGVIHRDLKPHNVMVGKFGEVQVMDWGLAKRLLKDEGRLLKDQVHDAARVGASSLIDDHRSSETRAGTILGTPAYMPPEQARGDIDRLDERSDVFGLGAILCEILTGRPPYAGANMKEVLDKAMCADRTEAFALLDLCSADPELVRLTKHCLAADLQHRPRNAGELTVELTAYTQSTYLRQWELEQARIAYENRQKNRIKTTTNHHLPPLAWFVIITCVVAFLLQLFLFRK